MPHLESPGSRVDLDRWLRPPSLPQLAVHLQRLLRTRHWLQIVVGMITGVLAGLLLSPAGAALLPEADAIVVSTWLALPGHLFLALIQMIVLPLVVSSIILGVAGGESSDLLRRTGARIGPYFLLTTAAAVTIGLLVSMSIKPGRYVDAELVQATLGTGWEQAEVEGPPTTTGALPERIVALIPANPLAAALDQSMLQIVVFALLTAVALLSISAVRSRPLLELAASLQELSMKIVSWAMVLAPIAVFGLLAQITTRVGLDAILGMSVYVLTVLLGLALLMVLYLALVAVVGGRSPRAFLAAVREPQLLAFSTSSSAAVMPLSLEAAESRLDVRPSIARFIIPLGATVNMDGTALYQVVAAVFMTQVFHIDLSLGALVLLATTTIGASIGTPSTPGVGIVILASVLQSVGVPATGVALIIGVDRILDMCRTTANVTGDLAACAVMDRWVPLEPRIAIP